MTTSIPCIFIPVQGSKQGTSDPVSSSLPSNRFRQSLEIAAARMQQLVGSRKIRPLGNKQRLSLLFCHPLFPSCSVGIHFSLSRYASQVSLVYSASSTGPLDHSRQMFRSESTDLVASGKLIAHLRLRMERNLRSASLKFESRQTLDALSALSFLADHLSASSIRLIATTVGIIFSLSMS